MDIKKEAIVRNALDGNAILFLGAGFSVGATNVDNKLEKNIYYKL